MLSLVSKKRISFLMGSFDNSQLHCECEDSRKLHGNIVCIVERFRNHKTLKIYPYDANSFLLINVLKKLPLFHHKDTNII